MSEIKLTPQQEAAVRNRGGDLLVSAAAGSGKTQVLVDRLMSLVLDEGKDINGAVVITYTRDAAAQLKAKITRKLSEKLAAEPQSEHLRRQMKLIYTTQISTVHAFCSNLLRTYASEAGISPDFRVMDEIEARAVRSEVMNDVIESVYVQAEKSADIQAFLQLTVGRDDKALMAIIFSVYESIQSHTWPEKWSERCVKDLDVPLKADAGITPWGRYIIEGLNRYAKRMLPLVQDALSICERDAAIAAAYNNTLLQDFKKVSELAAVKTWDEAYNLRLSKWARLGSVKKGAEYDFNIQEEVKTIRKCYKDGINSKLEAVQSSSEEVLKDLILTRASVAGLFQLVTLYKKRYQERKRQLGAMDYSDLEHFTIDLLLDKETGARTALAQEIAAKYHAVMIDEYQDTNEVQESIFSAISTGTNRFMVGDVKQSIYAFRLADPGIFLSHYHASRDHVEATEGDARKVLLTKNFRSRPEILSATNAVMRECMSAEMGGISYDESEALSPGRTDYAPLDTPPVTLTAIDMSCLEGDAMTDEEGLSLAKLDVEARYVAGRIRAMVNSEKIVDEETGELRAVRAGDIAIIMRAAKNGARHYVKALAEAGITAKTDKNGSLLTTDEVATLYCLLQVIDNPYQDVPLVGVLASPLFGFTAEELAQVKLCGTTDASFYAALQKYGSRSEKASAFLQTLTDLRAKAPYTRLSQLYYEMLDRTTALAVFGSYSGGDQREANIFAFGDIITSFEQSGARGLFQFLCYIETLKEQGVELAQPTVGTEEDAVTIMSTHASKGLEFPVVFLVDLSRRFNMSNLKASVLLDRELGAGMQVYDSELDYRYPTIARNAISMKSILDAKSEELRILYVAMTRAKQRLCMTYCDHIPKTLDRISREKQAFDAAAAAHSANCPGHWIIQTALNWPNSMVLYGLCDDGAVIDKKEACESWEIKMIPASSIGGTKRTMAELEEVDEPVCEGEGLDGGEPFSAPDEDALAKDLSFIYPHQPATVTPAAATPTSVQKSSPEVRIQFRRFGREKGHISAAERGTALHSFMQFADYSVCVRSREGIDQEIDRLRKEGFILPDQASAIEKEVLYKFFASACGQWLAAFSPERTRREFRFSLLLPANRVLPDSESEEPVLLSGIIDFFAELDDRLILCDFKSDYVYNIAELEEKVAMYRPQICSYAEALEAIYQKPVEKRLIFLRTATDQIIA